MIKSLIKLVNGLFRENEDIMGHDANGEICPVCKKPMQKSQGIWMVRSGEKMHRKCWGKFFDEKVSGMKKLHKGELDA